MLGERKFWGDDGEYYGRTSEIMARAAYAEKQNSMPISEINFRNPKVLSYGVRRKPQK